MRQPCTAAGGDKERGRDEIAPYGKGRTRGRAAKDGRQRGQKERTDGGWVMMGTEGERARWHRAIRDKEGQPCTAADKNTEGGQERPQAGIERSH